MDRVRCQLVPADDDFGRVVHFAPSKGRHTAGECRREHHGLPLGCVWEAAQDPPQVLGETHVKEAIAFIDDDDLGLPEGVGALFVVVDQPARCSNEDVNALGQFGALLVIVESAKDHVDLEIGVAADVVGIPGHLDRQFTGGRDDQSPRHFGG